MAQLAHFHHSQYLQYLSSGPQCFEINGWWYRLELPWYQPVESALLHEVQGPGSFRLGHWRETIDAALDAIDLT